MKTKLLLLILFISSITINAIDGEFFIRLKNFGATWYTLKVEKIPSEFYYDANYNLATPPNLYFFRRSDSLFTIQADRVRDDSNNGTIDDNGNEFLIYYGIYKITIEYDQTECWFIIDYKDCDYSEYHYFDPDMYFYIDYQEAKIIKTNNNFNANHGDYTSATYKVYEDLKYDGYKYANTAFFMQM
ncbi:MAG: hypothetical protein KKB34_19950 [Bacteroidetes bacterium]|nr:hypothetical protein [Bacteroidota bacterium]